MRIVLTEQEIYDILLDRIKCLQDVNDVGESQMKRQYREDSLNDVNDIEFHVELL